MPFANALGSEIAALAATVDPQDAATTAKNTDEVDMADFERIMAVVYAGAITGTVDAKLQSSTTSGGTFSDITGKSITQLAATDDNKQAIINLAGEEMTAGHRFVRMVVTPTGGTTNLLGAAIYGFNAKYAPASDNDLASVAQIVA